MNWHNKNIGNEGEDIAIEHLKLLGYTVLETKFTGGKNIGEIDIIIKKDFLIAFVEVKRRIARYNINPLDLVPITKQKKIIQLALFYCFNNNISINDIYTIRFDIIYCDDKKITYYENAFTKN